MYAPVPVLNGGLRRHSGSPPAGANDGVGGFLSSAARVTCCVFFCRHSRRRRLLYSPNLQSVQGRTPARGNRMFPPAMRGVWGASPPHSACTRNRFFAYQPQVTRRREPPPMPFAYHCHSRRSCFVISAEGGSYRQRDGGSIIYHGTNTVSLAASLPSAAG